MATTTKKSTAKKPSAKPRATKTAATKTADQAGKAPEGMVWSERFQEFVPHGSMRARPQ